MWKCWDNFKQKTWLKLTEIFFFSYYLRVVMLTLFDSSLNQSLSASLLLLTYLMREVYSSFRRSSQASLSRGPAYNTDHQLVYYVLISFRNKWAVQQSAMLPCHGAQPIIQIFSSCNLWSYHSEAYKQFSNQQYFLVTGSSLEYRSSARVFRVHIIQKHISSSAISNTSLSRGPA